MLESKRADLLAYFKHYITLRYCKWTQAWCLVMDAHLSYHTAAVSKMESARSIWHEIAKKDLPIEPELEERRKSARRSDLEIHKDIPEQTSTLNVKTNSANESYKQLIESTGVDLSSSEKEKEEIKNKEIKKEKKKLKHKNETKDPTSSPRVKNNADAIVRNNSSQMIAGAPRPKAGSPWKLFPTEDGCDYYYFNEVTGDSMWELDSTEVES